VHQEFKESTAGGGEKGGLCRGESTVVFSRAHGLGGGKQMVITGYRKQTFLRRAEAHQLQGGNHEPGIKRRRPEEKQISRTRGVGST